MLLFAKVCVSGGASGLVLLRSAAVLACVGLCSVFCEPLHCVFNKQFTVEAGMRFLGAHGSSHSQSVWTALFEFHNTLQQ